MKLEGSYSIAAPPDRVWKALLDPAVLQQVIPGCEKLTAKGENRYSAVVKAGVGHIKGTFNNDVAISDIDPGRAYTLTSHAQAPMGFVDGKGRVELVADGANTTINFSGDLKAGGALAAIAGRLFEAAAQKNINDMFANLARVIVKS